MTTLDDPRVRALLAGRNHAVLSTLGPDGGLHTTVLWIDLIDGRPALNGAVGRKWPADVDANPRISLAVLDATNPHHYVEIRGSATAVRDGAEEHIDRLAAKYLGLATYPGRAPGERRITYVVEPTRVRVWG
ncbi:PPOX class F420-dependent oxidoreductase [Kineococcus sp. NUM-3379]